MTQGARNCAWTSDSVPVTPLPRTATGATLCVSIGPNSEPLTLLAPHTSRRLAATVFERNGSDGEEHLLPGRVAVEYLVPGSASRWSRALEVTSRVGLCALTALLVFLFLREILPRAPWAATVGAICVAMSRRSCSCPAPSTPTCCSTPSPQGSSCAWRAAFAAASRVAWRSCSACSWQPAC